MADEKIFDLVIIGGGVSGLTAGLKAKESKMDFCILSGPDLGGKLQSFTNKDFIIERAANIIVEKPGIKALVEKLNLEESIVQAKKINLSRGIFLNKKIICLNLFNLLILISKDGRVCKLINLFRKFNKKIQQRTSVAQFTDILFNSKNFNNFISGILRGTYGVGSDELALSLIAPLFYSHLSNGHSPISYIFKKRKHKIFSFQDGNQTLVNSLINKLSSKIIKETCLTLQSEGKLFKVKTDSQVLLSKKVVICTDEFPSFLQTLYPELAKLANEHKKTSISVVHLLSPKRVINGNTIGILTSVPSNNGVIGILQPGSAFKQMQAKEGFFYHIFCLGEQKNLTEENLKIELEELKLNLSSDSQIIAVSRWKDAFPYYSAKLLKIIDEIKTIEQNTNHQLLFSCFFDGKGLGVADRVESAWNIL